MATAILVRDPRTDNERQVSQTLRGCRRDAQRTLSKMVIEAERGQLSPVTMAVAEMLEERLAFIEPSRSPNTIRDYRGSVHRAIVPALGSTRLAKLTQRDFDRAYACWLAQGHSPDNGAPIPRHPQFGAASADKVGLPRPLPCSPTPVRRRLDESSRTRLGPSRYGRSWRSLMRTIL
jgi:hypothetical protein